MAMLNNQRVYFPEGYNKINNHQPAMVARVLHGCWQPLSSMITDLSNLAQINYI